MAAEKSLRQTTIGASFQRANTSTKRKATANEDKCHSQKHQVSKRRKSNTTDPEQQDSTIPSQRGPSAESDLSKPKQGLAIKEEIGDIFDAPPNTLLIHSCNCQGSWHAGIADAFRKCYPQAFEQYSKHCLLEKKSRSLVGTALLIPPSSSASKPRMPAKSEALGKHFIGCIFTSHRYGKNKDSPAQILEATGSAMRELLQHVRDWNATCEAGDRIGEVRMCKINSGLFAVPWARTKAVLEGIDVTELDVKQVLVVSLE